MIEVSGYIPENIIISSRSNQTIDLVDGKQLEIIASTVYDNDKNVVANSVKKQNEPFDGLRIINQSINSGVYCRVIDKDGYCFILRPDFLADIITTQGIKKNGFIKGKFIWAKVHRTMKIVRIGSNLHKALERAEVRNKLEQINCSDFKPGTVYMTKAGRRSVFIGYVNTLYLEYKEPVSNLRLKKYQKRMLFLTLSNKKNESASNQIKKSLVDSSLNKFSVIKNCNYVQEVDKIKIPKDFINKVRRRAISFITSSKNSHNYTYFLSVKSLLAHMHPINSKLPEIPEYNRLLTLI